MKITDPAEDSGDNLKACGDDCNSDADCDSSCPNCFLGACFYFSKDSSIDHERDPDISAKCGGTCLFGPCSDGCFCNPYGNCY